MKRGTTGTIHMPGNGVDGCRAEVLRQSRRTGALSVRLLDNGDQTIVQPYEFKVDDARPVLDRHTSLVVEHLREMCVENLGFYHRQVCADHRYYARSHESLFQFGAQVEGWMYGALQFARAHINRDQWPVVDDLERIYRHAAKRLKSDSRFAEEWFRVRREVSRAAHE